MRLVYNRCAGLDVHKKTVVACRVRVNEQNAWEQEVQTFGTMTCDLLQLLDWLQAWEVSHVAMESTGEYWKPVYNLLEDNVTVLLVNAQHVKHVPGRKTDVKDAAPSGHPLADLLAHGLLKASFIPAPPQRELRDLTRYRSTLVQERARAIQRLQKVLEQANIKLASVATDVLGVSGRRMLDALVAGQADAATMAALAKGRLRNKLPELEKALTGIVAPHQRFLLAQQLVHIDFLDEQIETVSQQITQQLAGMPTLPPPATGCAAETDGPTTETPPSPLSWQAAVDLLDTAPGVDQKLAQQVLAEMGINMQQFPTAHHFAAWAGLAPGNRQSGGKRYPARVADGNQHLRTILVQGAWAAVRTKGTYLAALYRRLSARRGKKRAIVAVAHSLGVSFYHMLSRRQPYQDLGASYFDQRQKGVKTDWLLKQLNKLGYNVQLEPLAAPA